MLLFSIEQLYFSLQDIINNILNIQITHNQIVIISVYLIIKYIIFMITMFIIQIKVNREPYKAFIPFVNIYEYSRIVKVPNILFYVPILNIFIMILTPIKLAYAFNIKAPLKYLSIFIPELFIIYIAFSNVRCPYINEDRLFIHSLKDIDEIEKEKKPKTFVEKLKMKYNYQKDNTVDFEYTNNINQKIEKIENIQEDEYINEEAEDNIKPVVELMQSDENIEELSPTEDDDIIDLEENSEIEKLDEIETIEENSQLKEKLSTNIDRTDYEQYQKIGPDTKTIAFGGEKISEEKSDELLQAKENAMICPFCGSEIARSNGICPGCGRNVSELLKQ